MNYLARSAAAGLYLLTVLPAFALTGHIQDDRGEPIANAFVGALTEERVLATYALSGRDGLFSIVTESPPAFLAVQPPELPPTEGIHPYAYQPRLFDIRGSQEALVLRLPAAGCLVIRAHNANGDLMRWGDFEKKGTFGGVFLYATNLRDELVETVCWPIHDDVSKAQGSPREKGIPAFVVRPGEQYTVQALFWDVPGYGNILVRADNAGKGFSINKAGEARFIDFEVESARTAIADLERRQEILPPQNPLNALRQQLEKILTQTNAASRATDASRLLGDALRLRDIYEVEYARERIASGVRHGKINVAVQDRNGSPISDVVLTLRPQKPAFHFGVFEGGLFRAAPFKTAREAGFTLATVLPGWAWTDETNPQTTWDGLDRLLGITALRKMGFTVKAHGVLWIQEYGILPKNKVSLPREEFLTAAQQHYRAIFEAWHDRVDIWEIVNEPATVNAINLPRQDLVKLIRDIGNMLKEQNGVQTLINSPHESDYGRKYMTFALDGDPVNDYPLTYGTFLKLLKTENALANVDVIGLQFYSGARYNEDLGGYTAPAFSLGWFVDTVERYCAFGKPLHITEMSVPSGLENDDTKIAYWRESWTPQTQADYVDAIFTLAYANPTIESITYWDISDTKPSVVQGGLLNRDGSPKPVFQRLKERLHAWSSLPELRTDTQGRVTADIPAGEYTLVTTGPSGKKSTQPVSITVGKTTTVIVRQD